MRPDTPVPLGDGANAGLPQPDHAELRRHEEAVERHQGQGENDEQEGFHSVSLSGHPGYGQTRAEWNG